MARTDGPESAPLSLPDARLLSVSKTGELAISLGHTFEGWMGEGTLARSSMLGSAPRVLAEHVREAEWSPDGGDLAIVRRVGGLERLEFPLGKVLYQTSGFISDIRFSPQAIASRSPITRCMPTMRARWRWSIARANGRCCRMAGFPFVGSRGPGMVRRSGLVALKVWRFIETGIFGVTPTAICAPCLSDRRVTKSWTSHQMVVS